MAGGKHWQCRDLIRSTKQMARRTYSRKPAQRRAGPSHQANSKAHLHQGNTRTPNKAQGAPTPGSLLSDAATKTISKAHKNKWQGAPTPGSLLSDVQDHDILALGLPSHFRQRHRHLLCGRLDCCCAACCCCCCCGCCWGCGCWLQYRLADNAAAGRARLRL